MAQLLKITETKDNTETVWYKVVNFESKVSALNASSKSLPNAKIEWVKSQNSLELEEEYKSK